MLSLSSFVNSTSGVASDYWLASSSNTGTFNSFSFTGMGIGTPTSTRIVVVGVISGKRTGSTVGTGSLSIGGTVATNLVNIGGSSLQTQLWYANITSGTTATIAYTSAGTTTKDGCAIGIWIFYPTDGTPDSHGSDTYVSAYSPATLSVISGSTAFCVTGQVIDAGTLVSPTWSISGPVTVRTSGSMTTASGVVNYQFSDYFPASSGTSTLSPGYYSATNTAYYRSVAGSWN